MNPICKLAIAGLVGVAPLAAAGAAGAAPLGAAVYPGASYQPSIIRGQYAGYRHRHRGYPPAYAQRRWTPRHHFPYHTYVSPYRYRSYSTSWRPYPRSYGFGYARPNYAAAGYSAAVNPYFTSYSQAGTVSYPVYRIDHYKVDYSSPMLSYGSEYCGW